MEGGGMGVEENQEHKKKSEFRYTHILIISGSFSERLIDTEVQFPDLTSSQII